MVTATQSRRQPELGRRRSFRYSLRALLILVGLVAIVIGSYTHKVRQQERAVLAIRSAGGQVLYADSGPTALYWQLYLPEVGYDEARRRAPVWLEDWTGRDFLSRVVAVSFESGERHNIRYPRNVHGPFGPKVNPWYPDPRSEDMVHLSQDLLRQIGSLESVTSLYLAETDVDDGGVEHLASLRRLKYVALGNCVSAEAVGRLQRANPSLLINY